jgi:hypothetical protein
VLHLPSSPSEPATNWTRSPQPAQAIFTAVLVLQDRHFA